MTISTIRTDIEVWELSTSQAESISKHLESVFGVNWRQTNRDDLNDVLREWLYDNVNEPSEEVAGEGSLDCVEVE